MLLPFLGVTLVKTSVQSYAATVEAGITFIEDNEKGPIFEQKPGDYSSSDSTGGLPKTGGEFEVRQTVLGIILLGVFFYLVRGNQKKD